MSQASLSPYMIAGNLPFNSGGQDMISAAGGGALGQQYASAYSNALQQNQANYSNILQGYQQTQANQVGQQQAIAGGYNQLAQRIGQQGDQALQSMWGGQKQIQEGYGALQGQVQNTIQGVGASQAQAIQDAYKQQSGGLTQQLLNSGLGNTTVMGSMQRGPMLDAQKAQVALANQMAQLQAGYQAQLGQSQLNWQDQAIAQQMAQRNLNTGNQSQALQAGLGFQNQANQQATGQANQQLNWMNSIQSQYPSAAQYGQLLQQQGQVQQANADREQAAQQFQQQLAAQGRLMGMNSRGGFTAGTPGPAPGGFQNYIPPQPNMPAPLSFGQPQPQAPSLASSYQAAQGGANLATAQANGWGDIGTAASGWASPPQKGMVDQLGLFQQAPEMLGMPAAGE